MPSLNYYMERYSIDIENLVVAESKMKEYFKRFKGILYMQITKAHIEIVEISIVSLLPLNKKEVSKIKMIRNQITKVQIINYSAKGKQIIHLEGGVHD